MNIEQMKVGFMDVFCYIISCPRTNEALVIDPAGDEERVVERLKQKDLDLKYIVNTHGHPDHTCGNGQVKDLTGARIVMHELDDKMFNSSEGQAMAKQWGFPISPPADMCVNDNDKIEVGDISIEVIHTPGHSPGGICLLGEGNLFTGDTLFVGAIGRTDLPGGDFDTLIGSIKDKLFPLGGDYEVYSGHGPKTTIGFEKQHNPFLQG